MSTLVASATGNFTAAGTWKLGANELDSEANGYVITTTPTDGSNFTPGAITIDGIALKLKARAASPTGTLTVAIRNTTDSVTDATVTVNVADLPADSLDSSAAQVMNGWIVFQFGSVTLTAAKNYAIRVSTSSANQVTVYRDATASNPSRILRTTTTQAPAAGDKLVVSGELTGAGTSNAYTVTMDNTASTKFGSIGTQSLIVSQGGTLTFGTSASTAYLLTIAGIIHICRGGTLNVGAGGGRMPSTSSGVIQFDCTSNLDSAIRVNGGGTLNLYGATKQHWTTLTADRSAGAAVLTLASTTGWAANDEVGIAATERNSSHNELKIIQTVDSATQVTLTTNVSNLHKGSTPVRAHVQNLTRNVKILGESNSLRGYVTIYDGATINVSYVECKWLGENAAVGGENDAAFHCFNAQTSGVLIEYGAFQACSRMFYSPLTTGDGYVVKYNSAYNIDREGVWIADAAKSSWTIDNNVAIKNTVGVDLFYILNLRGTFTNNVANCSANYGFQIQDGNDQPFGTFSGNEGYCNAGFGMFINAVTLFCTLSSTTMWRNGNHGVCAGGANYGLVFDGVSVWGNNGAGIFHQSSFGRWLYRNVNSGSDATFTQSYGVRMNISGIITVENSVLGVATSHYTAHGTADFSINSLIMVEAFLNDVDFGHATLKVDNGGLYSIVRCTKYDATAGDHRTFCAFATAVTSTQESWQTDTTNYNTASPSLKLTPKSANYKLRSPVVARFAIASGASKTVQVYIRKDGAYNGATPRLIMLANPAIGIDADTVLGSGGGSGSFSAVSGSTGTAAADGVIECVVDCDGTAGFINIDDASIS